MDYLRKAFHPESRVTYHSAFEDVKEAPLLILDDLGQERGTPWVAEKLFQIIDRRYTARLPTVITTTRPYDNGRDPLTSRIQDYRLTKFITIDVPDRRRPPGD